MIAPSFADRTIAAGRAAPPQAIPGILRYRVAAGTGYPFVFAEWFKTGTQNRNNALLIDEIAPITAQYRASLGRIFADGFE